MQFNDNETITIYCLDNIKQEKLIGDYIQTKYSTLKHNKILSDLVNETREITIGFNKSKMSAVIDYLRGYRLPNINKYKLVNVFLYFDLVEKDNCLINVGGTSFLVNYNSIQKKLKYFEMFFSYNKCKFTKNIPDYRDILIERSPEYFLRVLSYLELIAASKSSRNQIMSSSLNLSLNLSSSLKKHLVEELDYYQYDHLSANDITFHKHKVLPKTFISNDFPLVFSTYRGTYLCELINKSKMKIEKTNEFYHYSFNSSPIVSMYINTISFDQKLEEDKSNDEPISYSEDQSNDLTEDQSNDLTEDQSNDLVEDRSDDLTADQSNVINEDKSNVINEDKSNDLTEAKSKPHRIYPVNKISQEIFYDNFHDCTIFDKNDKKYFLKKQINELPLKSSDFRVHIENFPQIDFSSVLPSFRTKYSNNNFYTYSFRVKNRGLEDLAQNKFSSNLMRNKTIFVESLCTVKNLKDNIQNIDKINGIYRHTFDQKILNQNQNQNQNKNDISVDVELSQLRKIRNSYFKKLIVEYNGSNSSLLWFELYFKKILIYRATTSELIDRNHKSITIKVRMTNKVTCGHISDRMTMRLHFFGHPEFLNIHHEHSLTLVKQIDFFSDEVDEVADNRVDPSENSSENPSDAINALAQQIFSSDEELSEELSE
jgi:hypothetical protein